MGSRGYSAIHLLCIVYILPQHSTLFVSEVELNLFDFYAFNREHPSLVGIKLEPNQVEKMEFPPRLASCFPLFPLFSLLFPPFLGISLQFIHLKYTENQEIYGPESNFADASILCTALGGNYNKDYSPVYRL